MARRIPLEDTIGGAYRFFFSNLLSIAGIVWFPLVLFGGLIGAAWWFGVFSHPMPPFPLDDQGHFDPAKAIVLATTLAPFVLLSYVCAIAAALMVTIGLTRKALGLMPGPTFFFFDFGASFWRLLAAVVLLVVILIALNLAMGLLGFAWMHFSAAFVPHPIRILVAVLARLVFTAIVIYTVVRLVFFLPAVVIVEQRIGLVRSWELGGGNFWRALLVVIAVLFPAAIVFALVFDTYLFARLAGSFPLPTFAENQHPDPAQSLAYAHRLFLFAAQAFKANWPVLLGFLVVYSVSLRSLYAGAVGSAYRGVTANDQASEQPSPT